MAQQFDYPKTETELREIQDKLYQHSKEAYEAGGRPAFKGLLEIMSAETTIITAIHNIKSNHGSETPGVDGKRMRRDYLQKPFSRVVRDIQKAFSHFEAQKIRRKLSVIGKNWLFHIHATINLHRWSAVCGESRTHGAKRGKIRPDCQA